MFSDKNAELNKALLKHFTPEIPNLSLSLILRINSKFDISKNGCNLAKVMYISDPIF